MHFAFCIKKSSPQAVSFFISAGGLGAPPFRLTKESAIVFHGESEIFVLIELVNGYNACGSVENVGNAVYDSCAGVFNGCGFNNVELGIGFAGDFPIAHIAVIGTVNFADALGFDNRSLEGFGGNYCCHTDAVAFGDNFAHGFGIKVGIIEIRNAFLAVGFNGPAEFGSKGFVGRPNVGRFENFGMSNLFFKFFGGKAYTVCFCKSKAVIFYVIGNSAFDFGDFLNAACNKTNHVYPEDIFHTGTDESAVVFFCDNVKFVGEFGAGAPAAGGFFAGGDYVDAAGEAFFEMIIAVAYEGEEGYNSNVCVAVIKNFVCVGFDGNAGFYAEFSKIADIHTYNSGVNVDCADNLSTVLVEIAQDILGHLAAAVLYYFNFFHDRGSLLVNYLSITVYASSAEESMYKLLIFCQFKVY